MHKASSGNHIPSAISFNILQTTQVQVKRLEIHFSSTFWSNKNLIVLTSLQLLHLTFDGPKISLNLEKVHHCNIVTGMASKSSWKNTSMTVTRSSENNPTLCGPCVGVKRTLEWNAQLHYRPTDWNKLPAAPKDTINGVTISNLTGVSCLAMLEGDFPRSAPAPWHTLTPWGTGTFVESGPTQLYDFRN